MATNRALRLFYSYSHKDERLLVQLRNHLSLLRRKGLIFDWHDRDITAGREWETEIDRNLEGADVIIFLVSADFLASDYCYSTEMKRAIERHLKMEARVIPIILREVDWQDTPVGEGFRLGRLQALPTDGKPIVNWPKRDPAWANVARGLWKAIAEFDSRQWSAAPANSVEDGKSSVPGKTLRSLDWITVLANDSQIHFQAAHELLPPWVKDPPPLVEIDRNGDKVSGLFDSSVIYGDIDDDGKEEAILRLESGGTAGGIGFLIYREDESGQRLVLARDGYKLGVAIEKGILVVGMPHYVGFEANCCPSAEVVARYRLVGDALETLSEEVTPNPVEESTVEAHYRAVAAGRFREAYEFLSPGFRASNPFSRWISRYAAMDGMTFVVHRREVVADSDMVRVSVVQSERRPSGDSTTHSFEARWRLFFSIPARRWLLDRVAVTPVG